MGVLVPLRRVYDFDTSVSRPGAGWQRFDQCDRFPQRLGIVGKDAIQIIPCQMLLVLRLVFQATDEFLVCHAYLPAFYFRLYLLVFICACVI